MAIFGCGDIPVDKLLSIVHETCAHKCKACEREVGGIACLVEGRKQGNASDYVRVCTDAKFDNLIKNISAHGAGRQVAKIIEFRDGQVSQVLFWNNGVQGGDGKYEEMYQRNADSVWVPRSKIHDRDWRTGVFHTESRREVLMGYDNVDYSG